MLQLMNTLLIVGGVLTGLVAILLAAPSCKLRDVIMPFIDRIGLHADRFDHQRRLP
jgi:hypothetical protein